MSSFIAVLRPHGAPPAGLPRRALTVAVLGAGVAIGGAAWLTNVAGAPLLLGSFGASCFLLFGYPDSPFSQPRNVVGGHLLASLVGLVCLALFGPTWWSMALALVLAVAGMHWTGTAHPPAGSNPVIVMLAAPGWGFLWTPTLLGAAFLVLVAWGVHRISGRRNWPIYWA